MSAVAIIPARGGSRRIPRKNIKLFRGKPIIAYSIEAAKESGLFDAVVVSSEDRDIGQVALDYGAAWTPRDLALSEDEIGTQEVARNVLQTWSEAAYDYACVIYPCAPMITATDLMVGADQLFGHEDPPPFVYVPGWFYWGATKEFLAGTPLDHAVKLTIVEPRWIDINTPEDWAKAEIMYATWRRKIEGDTDGVRA